MRYVACILLMSVGCLAQSPWQGGIAPLAQRPAGIDREVRSSDYPERVEANIAYDKFPDTRLDILTPKEAPPGLRPGVIMFHGGGWVRSTKETMTTAFCKPFLEQGFVVANVEYRVATAAPAPAAVEDALKAAQWFYDHAAQYHVDTRRIVVTGASAGGHLALMVGMTSKIPIAAIVNGYGVTDVADLLDGPHRQGFAVQWLPEQAGRLDLAKRMSPTTYVRKGLPPVLTVQGENDHTVPHEQGVRLTAALREAGDDAEMMTVPGAGHGFTAEQWPAVHARMFAFLRARGILPAAAVTADEAAIREIVARYVDARDQKDPKATEALFTPDADQLVSSGEWRRGREALVKGAMASSEASGGKRTITVETVRFLSPDVAIADGRYEIAGPTPRRMWASLTMKRTAEGWRIAAIRNMLPAAPVAQAK